MTIESTINIKVIKTFITEVLNKTTFEELDMYWDENMIWHAGSLGEVKGLKNYKKMLQNSVDILKLLHHKIEDIFACEDKVVVRFKHSGTQDGAFLSVPNSKKRVSWEGICIYKLQDYKITEAWFVEDTFGMMSTMGNIKKPN